MTPAPKPLMHTPACLPTPAKARLASFDVLRGFALLGALPIIIQAMARPWATHFNPTATGPLTGLDGELWVVSHILLSQKFIALFAILFGAGIVLNRSRVESRPAAHKSASSKTVWQRAVGSFFTYSGARALHARRMTWLFVFGIAQMLLIWPGGELALFAVSGALAFKCRNWPAKRLARWCAGFLALGAVWLIGASVGLSHVNAQIQERLIAEFWQPTAEVIGAQRAAFAGSWADQTAWRFDRMAALPVLATFLLWRTLGLMLAGMALCKWGVLSAKLAASRYVMTIAIALFIGFPLTLLGILQNVSHGWDPAFAIGFGAQFNYWGSLLVAGGYLSFIMLICKYTAWARLRGSLAAMGRMALSNYLVQILLGVWIFHPRGLDLMGDTDRADQFGIAVLIAVPQLFYSPLWLRYFHYGPAEWLWRSLTYRRLLPFVLMHRFSPRRRALPK